MFSKTTKLQLKLIPLIILLGVLAMLVACVKAGDISGSMKECQKMHSEETCFHILRG